MSSAAEISPAHARTWTVDGFKAFWGKGDPARLPAVRDVLTDDIVGYWPRPIGTTHGLQAYYKVIETIITGTPGFSLTVGEHASGGEFTFIRWIATIADAGRTERFTGCDRVRTRNGLVCENYIFCDHPFFERVAAQLEQIG
jgi:hypothetical protein